jgi:hypothetical protein
LSHPWQYTGDHPILISAELNVPHYRRGFFLIFDGPFEENVVELVMEVDCQKLYWLNLFAQTIVESVCLLTDFSFYLSPHFLYGLCHV